MKVLHCFEQYLPTTEKWAYELIEDLAGVEIVATSKVFLKNNFYNKSFKYIEFPVNLLHLSKGKKNRTITLLNLLIAKIRRFYFSYIIIHAKEVDIVHSHFAPIGWQYHFVAKKLKVPHVISFYGYDYEKLPNKSKMWKERYEILFKEAKMFICEGSHGAKILKEKGCPTDKIEVVKLGVHINNIPFTLRSKKAGELKLLQIASFTEKKGHIYSVKSFIDSLKDCPGAHLTLVGGDKDGKTKSKVLQIIKEHKAEGSITLLDGINYSELYKYMEQFHVFIHPSCYAEDLDCEGGAPVVLLDAQATGMPIIATTHCDIPDEVVHNETGLLADEKDVEMLTKHIKFFYNMDQEDYNQFAKQARRHVVENYDIKKNKMKLVEIYNSIFNAK